MIEHIVLLKFKSDTSKEHIEACSAALAALRDNIDVIKRVSVGENFSTRAQGYHLGLALEFENSGDLEVYQNHPDHRSVVDRYITPYTIDVIALDYKF